MKKGRTVIKLLISMVLCMVFSITALADDVTLAGDEVVKCNISFSVLDTTSSYTGDIKVIMTDITGTAKETYTLTSANSYGSGNQPRFSVPAPTTYEIKFEGLKEGYDIINENGSAVETFVASESGHSFEWKIVSLDQDNEDFKIDRSESTESDSNKSSDTQNQGPIHQGENMKTEVSNSAEEPSFNGYTATDIWKKFIEEIEFISDDPKWNQGSLSFMSNYERYQDIYAEEYEKYVKDGTKSEFLEMDLFERFLYEESYLRLASKTENGNYSYYFGDQKNFEKNVINEPKTRMSSTDQSGGTGEKVAKAYEELMNWQYQYIQVYHAPYDFIAKMNYMEAKGEKETEEKSTNVHQESKKDKNETEEKGIWDDTMSMIGGIMIRCIIACILAGAALFISLKRRKNNIDDK